MKQGQHTLEREQLHAESFLDVFVRACHRVGKANLVSCSSGNLSCRVHNSMIAISARGAWLENLDKNQVAQCRLEDGATVGPVEASVETQLHLSVMRIRPDVQVVLHFQSPAATTLACGAPNRYNYFLIPEIPLYVGQPAFVEYITPGSPQLAKAVSDAMTNHDMVFMRNHGLVTVGKDFDDAIQKACFMELVCKIILHGEVRPLTTDQIQALKNYLPGSTR